MEMTFSLKTKSQTIINFPNIAISYYIIMISVNSNFRPFIHNTLWFVIEIVFYLLVLLSLKSFCKKVNRYHIITLVLFLLTYIISFSLTTDLDVHISAVDFFLQWGIPIFILGTSVYNSKDLLSKLKLASILSILITFVGIFITKTNSSITGDYSQNTGYQSLISFAVFGVDFFAKKRKASIIIMMFSFTIAIMSGARGPLLAFILCFLIEFLAFVKITFKRILLFALLLFFILVIYYLAFNVFFDSFIELFSRIGLSTRILDGLKSQTIGLDSSRRQLALFSLEYAFNHLFYGTGLINDRVLLFNNLVVDSNPIVFGYYSHNIFLEILMQFGLFPGLLVCILLVYIVLKQFFINLSIEEKGIVAISISLGLLPLFVSYSYLTYQYFYFFIGLVLTNLFEYNHYHKKTASQKFLYKFYNF